jgi:tetratricopeptide (TPR) repeat protein
MRFQSTIALAVLPLLTLFSSAAALLAAPSDRKGSIFESSLRGARDAIDASRLAEAEEYIERALLRDPKSPQAWRLRADWAEKSERKDDLVHALHQELRLRRIQKGKPGELKAIEARILALDPLAPRVFALRDRFLSELLKLAAQYEKEGRPHSAIRTWRQALGLEPDLTEATTGIERVSAQPDPSLAASAKPKDLLADVSREWIREHDAKHKEWKTRAKLERDNYVTQTNAGYEVLVRTGEAMEQMSRFYRTFFQYQADKTKGGVPRIDVLIFKNREEYLSLGSNPPEWSGGIFTGGSVETYVGAGGFAEMVTTLFHEAAHQFVSLATSATGWLNEGLASFFEGTRILANGTVIMNMPANHRLFPLVARLERGWMSGPDDGLDPNNPNQEPTTAPTWQTVLENKYGWGPPWYAPTWGVVYFLYNYQDPGDGRFVYRAAFREFINSSSGRAGEGAVRNFEKVVLDNPSKPSPGYEPSTKFRLPRDCDELNEIYKDWMIRLAEEQSGKLEVERPFLEWARYALKRGEFDVAFEHFERGLLATPHDVELLEAFALHLLDNENNSDRASRILLDALVVLENQETVDAKRVSDIDRLLDRADPKRATASRLREELAKAADELVSGYLSHELPTMAAEMAARLGTELALPALFDRYEEALRKGGAPPERWQLAYNEENLDGFAAAGGKTWMPYGAELVAGFGEATPDDYDYDFLAYDKVSSGDFSFEAEVHAEPDRSTFCGLVFGRKAAQTFHALIFYPGHAANDELQRIERGGALHLSTFFGADASKIWMTQNIDTTRKGWRRFRVDVIGSMVDVWYDGDLVMRHDFDSADVLRGGFGLVTGKGTCRFRNVKYLARERGDLAGAVQRKLLIEKFSKAAGSGPLFGSWKGKVPPELQVARFAKGGFESFAALGPVPKLLVFWTIEQNQVIRIDHWLKSLSFQYAPAGLEIVSIATFADDAKLDEYLKGRDFPGHVAVDHKVPHVQGRGDTFTAYAVKSFPYLVLLDIDDVAVWQGDPVFVANHEWQPGEETVFDNAISALVERRNCVALKTWRDQWMAKGARALEAGDFDGALPGLKAALDLSVRAADVARAQRFVAAVAAAAADASVEPAARFLIDWAAKIERPLTKQNLATLVALAGSASAKDFDAVVKKLEAARSKIGKGDPWPELEKLAASLHAHGGWFVVSLRADFAAAERERDLDAVRSVIDTARLRPARWLVEDLATD